MLQFLVKLAAKLLFLNACKYNLANVLLNWNVPCIEGKNKHNGEAEQHAKILKSKGLEVFPNPEYAEQLPVMRHLLLVFSGKAIPSTLFELYGTKLSLSYP